jgi:TPR repeat protein
MLLQLFGLPLLLATATPSDQLSAAMSAFGTHRDREAAAGFRALAAEDSAIGETMLGVMYASGRVGARDPATAAAFWWRAASRGYPPAALALARAMAQGEGVRRDADQAFVWALIAARRGEGETRVAAQRLAGSLGARLSAARRSDLTEEADGWRPWPSG